jgi:hypothetical protein
MKLEYAKDPCWMNEEHTLIDLKIKWEGINEEFLFTANPNDCEAHGRAIFEQAMQGAYGSIAEYVAQEPRPTPASGFIPIAEV